MNRLKAPCIYLLRQGNDCMRPNKCVQVADNLKHKRSFQFRDSIEELSQKIVSITLHYIILHYITLHYVTLHYIALHYITLHYITLKSKK